MQSPFLPVESGLNLRKEAERLGVLLWRTPTFLSLVLGGTVMVLMLGIYWKFSSMENVEVFLIIEIGTVFFSLLFGGLTIRLIEEIALTRKVKHDLILTMSHKFKAPLAQIHSIVGAWEKEDGKKLQEQEHQSCAETMRKVENATERLAHMMEEFFLATRLDRGEVIWQEQLVDIGVLTQKICDHLQEESEEKGVLLSCEMLSGDTYTLGDSENIRIAIRHIILNALQYTERLGQVSVKVRAQKKSILVEIRDTGVGISKKDQTQIAQSFFRADNALVLNSEGVGLGLYISRKIIQKMNGSIRFESVKGGGTTFFVSFPKESNE